MPLLPGAEPWSARGGPVGVLLVHGFTGTPQSLRPWAEHLAAEGFAVELPLLPGHGTTWQDMGKTSWHDWYAAAERAFAELHSRCDAVVVMGLSMGGTLCLRLAETQGERVRGLVLVNPSLMGEHPLLKALPLLKRVLPSYKGVASDIKKPGVTEVGYGRLPTRSVASLVQLWAATRADLDKVTQPVLVFRSSVDHVVEPSSCRTLIAALGTDRVEERVLHESYHVATLDNDAPEIYAGSVEFVRRLTGAGGAAGPGAAAPGAGHESRA